jgi:amidophosphoribosyltransferase
LPKRCDPPFLSHPFDDDKLKEECGVFGVIGVADAANFVALGMHALQHRGQEAGGIVSYDPESGLQLGPPLWLCARQLHQAPM